MANNVGEFFNEFFGSDHEDDTQDSHEDGMHDSHEDTFDQMVREGLKSGMMFDYVERLHMGYNSFPKVQGFGVYFKIFAELVSIL